jgi:sugar lactone lactonase YvrE
MTTPTFTPPPGTIPARGSATFSTDASAWVTWQSGFEPELSVAMPWVAARVADVAADLALTNADVVSTGLDVVSTGDDVVTATAQVALAADEVALATTQANNAAGSATTALGYLDAFEDSYIGQYADDAAADASGKTIVDGVFYFKTTATAGLRIYNGGWSAAVLDAAGALLAANDLSDVASASTSLGNIGGAPLASPTFTGTPAAPTATVGTDTTQVATTAFVLANGSSSSVAALTPAATVDISLASADYFTITLDQNTTFTVSNVDAGVDTFNLAITGYTVSESSYNIASASYDSSSFSVSSQSTQTQGIFFKPDGTRMYVMDAGGNNLYQYSLSTAWDISSASYDSVSFSAGSQDTQPRGIFFKPDGLKLYITAAYNKAIYQYSLSTAWDASSLSYDSVSFSAGSQDTQPSASFFKPDGTKLFIYGSTNKAIFQYSLSTAWVVSSASYDSVSFSLTGQISDGFASALFFTPDGLKMYAMDRSATTIFEYNLSTAWVVSSASYNSVSFSVGSQDTTPRALFFKPDGLKMYAVGTANNTAFQYTTGEIISATATYPSSFKFPNGTTPAVSLGGELNILEAQTTDGGTTFNVTQLGADFS